jgi:hypothetical protein
MLRLGWAGLSFPRNRPAQPALRKIESATAIRGCRLPVGVQVQVQVRVRNSEFGGSFLRWLWLVKEESELGEESAIVVLRTATANCKRWIDEAFNDDAQPVAMASMKRARYMVRQRQRQQRRRRAAAQQPRRQADMKVSLKAVLGELDSDDFRHLWSAESLALARQQLRQFYVTPATKDVFLLANLELIKPLARLIFSLSPVSAGAERAFSCSCESTRRCATS